MKIVIIIPTYNERPNVEKMIPLLEEEIFPKIKNHHLFILIVDDKSPDGTADLVGEFTKKWNNIELLTGEKNGLGAAYVRGMKYAMDKMDAHAVMEFDSDFQHNPHDIPRLIHAMDEGADYVIGSRYIPGGSIPKGWGVNRKFLSVFGSLFIRIVWLNFAIHDMTSGFKLTKTTFLKKVDLDHLLSKNFAYKVEILHDIVKEKAKVSEVPIVFNEREEGKSKINVSDQFESFYVVIRLAMRDRKRFIKFLFVGGTGFILQFLTVYVAIFIGMQQSIAAMIGGEIAILWNFTANNKWTFSDTKHIKEQGSFLRRLIKFNVASLASIAIQGLVVHLAVQVFGEQITLFGHAFYTSFIVLIPTILFLVIPINYVIYNRFIWKTHHLKKND